ncbi:glycosyltransferase [Martelella lutilitoris]|uniref:Glycosyltransferase n=1 Tax=Martelella lutilitoris TaxID=2583532 RepID=A0A7T7HL96_9HYPH|nr:glycosyltransferase [Martelella lutilitoris]QQM31258.1 glycosyltransferase [Martelella lutilitoris]
MGEVFEKPKVGGVLEWADKRHSSEIEGQQEVEHLHRYLFARALCRGRDVLDIVSRGGYGSACLSQVARSVIGVELDQISVERARSTYQADNLEFKLGSVEHIPLDDNSIDCVVSFGTIEFLSDEAQFLNEIKRVLRPGGFALINLPNHDIYSPPGDAPDPNHARRLTNDEFETLLSTHFSNSILFRQRSVVGSVILSETTTAGQEFLSFDRQGEGRIEASSGLARSLNIVAIVSNDHLPALPSSAYFERTSVEEALVHLPAAQNRMAALEQENEKYKEDLQNLAEALGLAEHRSAFMQETADVLASRLYKAYQRPLQPITSMIIRRLLHIALAAEPILSQKRIRKFRRSLRKCTPRSILSEWNEVKEAVSASIAMSAVGLSSLSHREDPPFLMDPKKILVIDARFPQPNVSAGEKATFGILKDLVMIGFDVTFIPIDMKSRSPYLQDLDDMGVRVITRERGFQRGSDYLRLEGHRFGVFYVFRIDVFEQTIEHIRNASPNARVIFHAPDLNFLREFRGAELSRDSEALKRAKNIKQRELSVMRKADHNVLVSPAELPYLVNEIPAARFSVFPALYSPIDRHSKSFAERKHIFFLGGFGHSPNVDAAIWFVSKIWPAIHAALPDVEFHILGSEAPQEIIDLADEPGVRFVGYVEDIESAMSRYRLAVAPLNYGAGIKGKVGASMGCGIPTVCTSIAAEGMHIENDIHTFVADTPSPFADAVIKLYPDHELWDKFSKNGRRLVEENFSCEANRSSYLRALDKAKVLPLDLIVSYCQNAPDVSFPEYDEDQTIGVSVIVPVYNKWSLTRACLASVALAGKASGITYEVILADDGSTDETVHASEMVPGLRVARAAQNMGFLGNCNNAAKTAKGEHLLFLTNNTVVMPNWLKALYSRMTAASDAAIVGSKLLYTDGRIQEGGGLLSPDATAASFLVSGAFWRSIGGFEERDQPTCCEESDLAMAARSSGLSVLYEPESEVVHFEKAT